MSKKNYHSSGKMKISQTFQKWLTVCVLVAFVISGVLTFWIQTRISDTDTNRLLRLNIEDLKAEIERKSDENMLRIARLVVEDIETSRQNDGGYLRMIADKYHVSEINLIGTDGIIYASTYPDFIGFDMASGEQSAEFLVLLNGQSQYVQPYQHTSYDSSLYRKYAGVTSKREGFIQVAYDAEYFQEDLKEQLEDVSTNRHIRNSGGILICDEDWDIVSGGNGYTGKLIDRHLINAVTNHPEEKPFSVQINGNVNAVCMYMTTEGYYIMAILPQSEVSLSRNVSVLTILIMEILLFAVVFFMIYNLINKLVVQNIRDINYSLMQITEGNLDERVEIRTNEEFDSLSNGINMMVEAMKYYIDEAARRLEKELETATKIQASMLPSITPVFSERTEFNIYASMTSAKEIGGDFYDFFFIDEDHLALVIADVSGKGIPAALFMVKSMTLIRNTVQIGVEPYQVMEKVNNQLCEGNEAGMFVTVWLGLYEISTGKLTYANAGHEYPAVMHQGGGYELICEKHNLALACMENMKYQQYEVQLNSGDKLFLYTDGVPEATNSANELFGNDQMLAALNECLKDDPVQTLHKVHDAVNRFVGTAPQFDDLTMLGLDISK